MPVTVVHWNPRRPVFRGRLGRRLPVKRHINNFGDLLGPVIVAELIRRTGLREPIEPQRLLAVGSILRLARQDDTLWGIGANGKSLDGPYDFTSLDVRAVRGPMTRRLLSHRGIDAPAVYGDPGLLVGHLWQRDALASKAGRDTKPVVIVPNFHDFSALRDRRGVVNPTAPMWEVIGKIAQAELVVGSSLHAIVVAESLGVPARLIDSGIEPTFKYDDYFQGTGRQSSSGAPDLATAMELGGAEPPAWDSQPLLNAFPADLWLPAADSIVRASRE